MTTVFQNTDLLLLQRLET